MKAAGQNGLSSSGAKDPMHLDSISGDAMSSHDAQGLARGLLHDTWSALGQQAVGEQKAV
ncbi:MAG TPA: hypothetical protein VNY51_11150 [Candidatus Dormibacteraeota bacterium]|nr:hypothetical protein [Candidatus Dormibacteraeota bacterium]